MIDSSITQKIQEAILAKSQGKEKDIIQNIVKMDEYIEKFLKDDLESPHEKTHVKIDNLNKELRKIVLNRIQKP